MDRNVPHIFQGYANAERKKACMCPPLVETCKKHVCYLDIKYQDDKIKFHENN
jgi:RNA-binding protein YlmH